MTRPKERCMHSIYRPSPGECVVSCLRCHRPVSPVLDAKGRHRYAPGYGAARRRKRKHRPEHRLLDPYHTPTSIREARRAVREEEREHERALKKRRRNHKLKKLAAALAVLPQSRGRVKLADVIELLKEKL